MSTDYGEKERQFLETLKADTGRAIDEWMSAIAAEGLTHRNDIIDWLRRQGFMFSKASWIERIHNNGGRPIYSGTGALRPQTRPRNGGQPRLRIVQPSAPPLPEPVVAPQPVPATPTPTPSAPPPPSAVPAAPIAMPPSAAPASDPAALDALLAKAKAFRPLAVYLVAEIRKAVPGATMATLDGAVAFRAADKDFAVLAISAKELRLGLALASKPADVHMNSAKLTVRGAMPMDHVIALTDARQITPALLAAVTRAAGGG
ncbi:MAG TPA: hypothetical protein VEA77_04100 [Hyphomicrobium sp.]|nr:hypothetical protein [Hyphomicrobium sp.]